MSNDRTDDDFSQQLLDGLSGDLAQQMEAPAVPDAIAQRIRQKVMKGVSSVTERANENWTQLSPLVRSRLLFADENQGCQITILELSPGAVLSGHYHRLDEECLVLEGEFCVGDLTLKKGDFHLVRKGSFHEDAYSKTGCTLYLRHELDENYTSSP